jgi:hypothetical protein
VPVHHEKDLGGGPVEPKREKPTLANPLDKFFCHVDFALQFKFHLKQIMEKLFK